jgi:hypothetical protein
VASKATCCSSPRQVVRPRCLRSTGPTRLTLFRCHVRLQLTLALLRPSPASKQQTVKVKHGIHHFFGSGFDVRRTLSWSLTGFAIQIDAVPVPPLLYQQTSSSLVSLSAALEAGGAIALIHPPTARALCSYHRPHRCRLVPDVMGKPGPIV